MCIKVFNIKCVLKLILFSVFIFCEEVFVNSLLWSNIILVMRYSFMNIGIERSIFIGIGFLFIVCLLYSFVFYMKKKEFFGIGWIV